MAKAKPKKKIQKKKETTRNICATELRFFGRGKEKQSKLLKKKR